MIGQDRHMIILLIHTCSAKQNKSKTCMYSLKTCGSMKALNKVLDTSDDA
jgi:hypothetical protein